MILAGVDISTRHLHTALIPLDSTSRGLAPAIFRDRVLPKTTNEDERFKAVFSATRHLLRPVDGHLVSLVYVERPSGKWGQRALWAIFGAVMASVPNDAVRQGIPPSQWRSLLAVKATKAASIQAASDYLGDGNEMDEHFSESLLVALAGRAINDHHFRAA